MIKNFDEIKVQLKDLSEVINGFKSEAVQLRIVELVFRLGDNEEVDDEAETPAKKSKPKRKPAKNRVTQKTGEAPTVKKGGKRSSGQGAVATLMRLVEGDFFDSPRTISDIVEHCDHNMARKFKANGFSGKLGRLVRDGTLVRTKNAENQYEYQGK